MINFIIGILAVFMNFFSMIQGIPERQLFTHYKAEATLVYGFSMNSKLFKITLSITISMSLFFKAIAFLQLPNNFIGQFWRPINV